MYIPNKEIIRFGIKITPCIIFIQVAQLSLCSNISKLLIKVCLNGGYDRVLSQFHNPIKSTRQLSLIGLRTVLHQLADYLFLTSQSPFEETSVMVVVSTIILIQTTVASNSEEGAIGARPASCLTKFSSSEEIVGLSIR